jgi:hypothetical protein
VSYTLFARSRPIRTAFLVDESVFVPGTWQIDALLDGIVSASDETWGGRMNPLVLMRPDSDLGVGEWNALKAADPDLLRAFCPLPNEWVSRLHDCLQPWSITVQDESKRQAPEGEPAILWNHIGVQLGGIPVPPTPVNLKRLSQKKLLMIEFSRSCPLDIRRFFHRNFGTYYQWFDHRGNIRRIAWLEDILPLIDVETALISDNSSTCDALDMLAGNIFPPDFRAPLNFTAICQLQGLDIAPGIPCHPYDSTYRVFIGDAARDFAAYWNDVRVSRCWRAPYRHALWVPSELALDESFAGALQRFLYEYTTQHSSGSRTVELASESLDNAALEVLAARLQTGRARCRTRVIDFHARKSAVEQPEAPAAARPRRSLDGANAERFRFQEREETLNLSAPDILVGDGSWSIDAQVEFGTGSGIRLARWWCLPRREGSDLARLIFRKQARVNRDRLFSVPVQRFEASVARPQKPQLCCSLPAEADLVGLLLTGPHGWFDSDDAREGKLESKRRIERVEISSEGKALRGLIDVFGGFWAAREFCERRFWREAFMTMAGQDAKRNAALKERVANVLAKDLPGNKSAVRELATRQARRVMPHFQGSLMDRSISYDELKAILQDVAASQSTEFSASYPAGDATVHELSVRPISELEMAKGLDDLVARNILRCGVEMRCDHCGVHCWFHVDDLKQANICSGCGNYIALPATAPWRYRLNSLVQRSVSARTFAVLQALAQLAHRAMNSFFYSPSLDVYRPGDAQNWHEIDIPCVADGRLIIGEVKDGDFNTADLDGFVEVAERLRPDCAAVFLPVDRLPKSQAATEEIRKRLAGSGVPLEIHGLPQF